MNPVYRRALNWEIEVGGGKHDHKKDVLDVEEVETVVKDEAELKAELNS